MNSPESCVTNRVPPYSVNIQLLVASPFILCSSTSENPLQCSVAGFGVSISTVKCCSTRTHVPCYNGGKTTSTVEFLPIGVFMERSGVG